MISKEKILTINEYIALQRSEVRPVLKELRSIIKKTAPKAEEVISYGMPAFKMHKVLIWFAAYKNHYAIYPYPKTIQAFKEKLKPYQLSKGTIQFPLDKPIPVKLITEIVKYRIKEDEEKQLLKDVLKKKK